MIKTRPESKADARLELKQTCIERAKRLIADGLTIDEAINSDPRRFTFSVGELQDIKLELETQCVQ